MQVSEAEIGGVEGRVEQFLALEFGFGEGDGEFVALQALAFVLGDVAGMIRALALADLLVFRLLVRAALESARRFEQVVQARGALSNLSARVLEVQESERRALSRELHDDVGQSLSALLLAIGNVAALIPPTAVPARARG
ncbi:MAG: histidine kinase [Bryobacteraceae bacterium]